LDKSDIEDRILIVYGIPEQLNIEDCRLNIYGILSILAFKLLATNKHEYLQLSNARAVSVKNLIS